METGCGKQTKNKGRPYRDAGVVAFVSTFSRSPSYQKVCGRVWRAPQHCMARRAGRTPSIHCSGQAQAHPAARRAKRKFLNQSAARKKNETVSMDGNKEDMVMGAEETFPILDDVELPPAKGRAARP